MSDNVSVEPDPSEIPPESIAAIDAAFAALDQHLRPHLESAGTDDGRSRARMGDRSEPFVGKVRDYLVTNPEFMPGYADSPRFQRAVARIDTLRPYQRRFDQYKSLVDDTVGNAGSDALEAGALPYYKTVKEAAKNKQAGAVTIAEDLGVRFAGNRAPRKKVPAASPERPSKPPAPTDRE